MQTNKELLRGDTVVDEDQAPEERSKGVVLKVRRDKEIQDVQVDEDTSVADVELSKHKAEVSEPGPEAPNCVHCGSFSTYYRVSDGDIGCNNCPSLMKK